MSRATGGPQRTLAVKDAPERIVLDLGGGVKMEFVRIKAGEFMMGSGNGEADEKPVHEVTISRDFWMQTTETTQAQWEAVMGKKPSYFKGADLPVEDVSWENCREFMKKLNEKAKEQLEGKTAGLPTEAQWEYACRAGSTGKWCFGDDENKLGDYAWHQGSLKGNTQPVGQRKPNSWGLCDMHGNVWEWCEDWYGVYPSEAVTDPNGPASGKQRCLRGGSWVNAAAEVRASVRLKGFPLNRVRLVGFRVALR
ncbi:MAG: formylglycine-generating enzyme family protein [Planctomycetes bacterium]|nr:formylglycine-generating enzyme family protein [Planctomycetota bacterium]